jgi:hypothetical protein
MRRLLVLATFLLLIAGIAFIVARVAFVPYAERRAADAIGARLGAPVTVHASGALSPGLVSGDLGTLHVRAPRVQRDGFTLTGFLADVDGASIDVERLVGGDAVLSFSRITVQARVGQASLTRYVRSRLRQAGVPGWRKVRTRLTPGTLTVVTPAASVATAVTIAGPSAIRLVPQLPLLRGPLSRPIELGPFPYGLRLSEIHVEPGQVVVTGGRGPGTETLS